MHFLNKKCDINFFKNKHVVLKSFFHFTFNLDKYF